MIKCVKKHSRTLLKQVQQRANIILGVFSVAPTSQAVIQVKCQTSILLAWLSTSTMTSSGRLLVLFCSIIITHAYAHNLALKPMYVVHVFYLKKYCGIFISLITIFLNGRTSCVTNLVDSASFTPKKGVGSLSCRFPTKVFITQIFSVL